ncbi:MAG: hypothetical protein SynsKO_43520 [Synoicihabitans sp.]
MQRTRFLLSATLVCLATGVVMSPSASAQQSQRGRGEGDWHLSEYGSDRSAKDLRTAFASKCFAWLSGSPADNEKLSIGKNAQFFGFVALRYQSGRAANRGALGRAFFDQCSPDQRKILESAVMAEMPLLDEWWSVRNDLLRLLEAHLYNNEKIDEQKLLAVGAHFGALAGEIALIEAEAFAALEDTLTAEQLKQLADWRTDPEKATQTTRRIRVRSDIVDTADWKQLEDLFAKGFSWLTGTRADTQIIPLGQPAQFFGFVSIRHKSGHAASRGRISRAFLEILSRSQEQRLADAVIESKSITSAFFATRLQVLDQMQLLRDDPDNFDRTRYTELSQQLGAIEAAAAAVEARAYRDIRASMKPTQLEQMMALRGDYIIDPAQVESLSIRERGEMLFTLCVGCHGAPDQRGSQNLGPSLDRILGRKIAATRSYEYSQALQQLATEHDAWTPTLLDQYLQSPRQFAPGTKMEFQGLLQAADRSAVISYLESLQE